MWHRVFRSLAVTVSILVEALVLFVGGLVVLAQTEAGRTELAQALSELASSPGESELRIEGIGPGLPLRLSVERLTLADAAGPWLEVRDLRFGWRPWALLGGRLHVTEVGARVVDVMRPPISPAEPAAQPPEQEEMSLHIPRLPVAVRINRLTVEELRVSGQVTGEPLALRVDGRLAAAEGRTFATDLNVRPVEENAAGPVVRVSATYDTVERSLVVDARVREPAGGPLSAILGLAERPALSMTLVGRGPVSNWRGNLAAEVERLGVVQADLSLHVGEAMNAEITGRAMTAEGLVPAFSPALAQGVQFDAQLSRPDPDILKLERLWVNATGASITGSGTLDLEHSSLAADLQGEVAQNAFAPGVLGPVDFVDARVTATASGSVSVPSVRATGQIDGMRAPGVAAKALNWTATLQPVAVSDGASAGSAPGWALQADVQTDGVALAAAAASGLVGDRPTLSLRAETDATAGLVTLQSLQIDGRAVSLAASGTAATGEGAVAADLRLTVSDLARIGRPGLAGRAVISSRVEGNTAGGTASGTLQLETERLASGIAAADALFGPQPKLDATFTWSAADGITVPQARLAGHAVQGEARVRVTADGRTLDAGLDLQVPSLQPLSAALGTPMRGSSRLQATATGNPADPQVAAELRLDDAAVGETGIQRAGLHVRASQVVSAARGRVEADAQTDMGPLSAATDFALEGGDRLHLSGMAADGLGLVAQGELQAALNQQRIDGFLHATPRAPSAGVRFGGTAVTGPFDLDLRFRPDAGAQQVQARFHGGRLSVRNGDAEVLELGTMLADVDIADALRAPRFSARLALADGRAGDARLARAEATAEGTLQGSNGRAQITASATAPDTHVLQVELGAEVAIADAAVAIELRRLDGTLVGEPLALAQRARLLLAGNRMQLEGLILTLGPARFSADGRLQPGETTLAFDAEDVPASLGRAVSPQAPADGRLDTHVALRTLGRETIGEADVHLSGLTWQEGTSASGKRAGRKRRSHIVEDHTRLDLNATARLGGGRLSLDGTAAGEGVAAKVLGGVPVRLPAGTLAPVVDRDAAVDGRLTLSSDLRVVANILAFHDQRLEGGVDGDLRFGGTLKAPVVGGGVNVRNGLYENFVSGTLLQDIAIAIEAEGQRGLRLQMTGSDGNSGRISVDGHGSLNEAGDPIVDATVKADRATLVRRDDATVATDARLDYAQQGANGRLTGEVETVEVQIRLLDRLPPQVVVLPVREIGRPEGDDDGLQTSAEPWSSTLDLSIRFPRRVFVRGRGLESEWAGALAVTGTTAEPQIGGEIHLVRGDFTFGGKRFELQRGIIRFDGSKRLDPYIDAVAEYRTSALTAQIAVAGLSSEPKLVITSQPPLPASEILAQVLFGKSSAKLGPVEAVQLAAAVDALARGESMSDNVFDFARTLLGLDTLTVQPGSGEDEGSSIAVGRYVGDRVYIGAQQGLGNNGSQSGTVEVEIAPGISIESEIEQDRASGPQGSLGLKWKLDY